MINKVEIQVAGAYRDGWPQLDAVGLTASNQKYRQHIHLSKNSREYGEPYRLGASINSIYNEVHPVISPDGSRLYFVRTNHPENTGGKDAGDDIWYSSRRYDGTWTGSRKIGAPLNNEKSCAVYSILPGSNTLLLRDSYSEKSPREKSVALSRKQAIGWQNPVSQTINQYFNRQNHSSFFLANDGRTLLMAVERYDGKGGLDLYVSFKTDKNHWSKPKHLGNKINTAADEITPFLAADNKTLFFSTKGFPGYGNNDIFMTRRQDSTWQNWSEPLNLGQPVNTEEWNAYFTLPASGQYAYYVSYKESGNMADIYRVRLPQDIQPVPVLMVEGKILDAETGKPVNAEVINESLLENMPVAENTSSQNEGKYKMIMPKGEAYGLLAKAEGYMPMAKSVDVSHLDSFSKKVHNIYMVPIEVGQTIRLNNIFFEFNKSTLKSTSYPELDRVASLMENHENMVIEVAGHTDSVGSDRYNKKLSKDRAEAVKTYLVEEKEINAERIKTKGYGESKPIATNKTEKGRQANRRVNFTILEK